MKNIFEIEEEEWSVQGYIDEKELHDSIVDINKQNQNAVNEQLLNGKYDGITGEPIDVATKRYVDIDAVLKDQERTSGDPETEHDASGNSDGNSSYQANRFSKDRSTGGSYYQGNSGEDARIGNFENRSNIMSKEFSDTKGFEAAGKTLNMVNRVADLALNSSVGKYDANDPKTPYMAEYDVAEKALDLAGKGAKKTVKGAVAAGHLMKKGAEKVFRTNVTYEQLEDDIYYLTVDDDVQCVNDDDFIASHGDTIQDDNVFETVTAIDALDMDLAPNVPLLSCNDQSAFGGDGGSIDGLIEQLGIIIENENISVASDSGRSANMLLLDDNQPENHMGLMVISDSDIEDLSEKLGIVSENEVLHESGVVQVFESVADSHGVIVPDTENLSDTDLVLFDGNHARFDQDSDMMQQDLEQKLGIYDKKSKKKKGGGGFGDLKNNIKNREKALARERFKFMVSVLINENKGGPTTDSGLGQIIFGGAARRIGGITGFFGKKILKSLLPYVAAGMVALILLLGGFLGIAGIIAFPLFTIMNVSSGAGRELTVMNQDFDYPSNQDYIYTRAVSLYEDFCYDREDIIATYDDGLNEFVYDSNSATDFLSNAFSLIWAYLTTVDDEGITNEDDLIVSNPSDSFDVMQRVSKEMFYYEKETIYKTITVTDADGNSSTQTVEALRFTFIEKNYIRWFNDKFPTPSHAAQNEYDLIVSLTDGATPGSITGINLGDGTPPEAYDDALVAAIFAEGERYLGVPYRLNPLPTPPTSFCCDIFVKYVFQNVGIAFPPNTYTAQGLYDACVPVPSSEAKAGDLIFFSGTYANGRTVTHVGIYCGNGVMLHSGNPVKYTNVNTPYWQSHFYSFGRYGVNN